MSLPRQVVPGRVYLLTRRCSERRFFMKPDPATCNAFVYCLGVSAERYQIDVVAFGMMANHHHLVVVDREGRLPDFLQYFHRIFAAHQNVLRGRSESFWAAAVQPSAVELIGPEDILDKMAYAICNPVKDHIVDQLHHWPGPNAMAAIITARPIQARRPSRFFRSDGPMPPATTLTLVRPPGFETLSDGEFAQVLRSRADEFEQRARMDRLARGARVLGRRAVLRQHWNERPHSHERRRTIDPRIACRYKWARLETLRRNRAWLEAYIDARRRWLLGEANVLFPAGAWWLPRRARVACEDASSAAA
jgi:putative transposase